MKITHFFPVTADIKELVIYYSSFIELYPLPLP